MCVYVCVSVGIIKPWLCKTKPQNEPVHVDCRPKADVGQAGTVATVTADKLVRAWWHSVVVHPPELFVLEAAQQAFSKKETKWLVVRHQASQFSARMDHQAMVDVTCTKWFFSNSPFITSLVHPCHKTWRRTHWTIWSWAGDDSQSWKHAQPSVEDTLLAWPWCWWYLPF